jgi:hypothetical protein
MRFIHGETNRLMMARLKQISGAENFLIRMITAMDTRN